MEAPSQANGLNTPIGVWIFVICIVFIIFTVVFTLLRFVARSYKSGRYGFGPDDWVLLSASVIAIGNAIMTVWGAARGYIGPNLEDIPPARAEIYHQLLFANYFVALGALALVKIAVLLFYRRIFVSPKFHLTVYIMISIIIAWFLAFFIVALVSGIPISNSWTFTARWRLNFSSMLTANVYTNLIIDITVLAMPIPMIKSLNLDLKRKLTLAGLFSLGFLCVIATSIRLHYLVQLSSLTAGAYDSPAITKATVLNLLWSNIEACCSVIAACLPTLSPLFKARSHFRLWSWLRCYLSGKRFIDLGDDREAALEQQHITHRVFIPNQFDAHSILWNTSHSAAIFASHLAGTGLHGSHSRAPAPNNDELIERFNTVSSGPSSEYGVR